MSITTSTIQPDVTAIADYAGDHVGDLFATIVNRMNLEQQGITVIQNMQADGQLIKLSIGNGIRPYNGGEQYESAISYSKRKLRMGSVKKEILIDTKKYKRTWLAKYQRVGANPPEIPFAEFTLNEAAKKFGSEILGNLVFNGLHEDRFAEFDAAATYAVGDLIKVSEATGKDQFYICITITTAGQSPTTTPAKWTNMTSKAATDGFKVLIDELIADSFAETTIGVINNTSIFALASFRKLARSLDQAVWDDPDMKIYQYCSLTDFFLLQDDVEDKLAKYTVFDLTTNEPVQNAMYLPGTNNKVIVIAVNWLNGSRRILTTYEGNLHFGTNLMSDANEIATKPNLWTLGLGMLMDLGFQIADDDSKVLVLNDQD